jgi:hypothetical protein
MVANTHLEPIEPDEKDVRRARRQLAEALRMRVQRPNHDGLLEDLMEPVARQGRRRAVEMICDAA